MTGFAKAELWRGPLLAGYFLPNAGFSPKIPTA
jgi:hypothetical protein